MGWQLRSDGLPVPGWEVAREEPWLVLAWTPRPVSSRAAPVRAADAADRVLVQRSAFAGSTFTVERWRSMQDSPAGGLAVETLVRTPGGEPAALYRSAGFTVVREHRDWVRPRRA